MTPREPSEAAVARASAAYVDEYHRWDWRRAMDKSCYEVVRQFSTVAGGRVIEKFTDRDEAITRSEDLRDERSMRRALRAAFAVDATEATDAEPSQR